MQTYSKSHEREENRKINQGFWNSFFALVFCWLPGIGLLLAIMGFFRVIVRLTSAHRVKRILCTFVSAIVLIVCVFALVGEAYLYIQNPNIVLETARKGWTAMTGEAMLPWETDTYYDYADYPEEEMYDDVLDMPEGDEYYTDDEAFYDDYDDEFDESELAGFEEEAPDGTSIMPEDTSDAPSIDMDLLNDMLEKRNTGLAGMS